MLPTISFSSTLANMSSPGTSSFIGEFPISVGAFQRNSLVATLAALGMILGAAYSLWLYNRAVSGNLKPDFLHKFSDPNGREVSIFLPFLVGGATRGPGGTERKKGRGATMHGTSRPCLRGTVERATHECCRVGRANNSKVFGQFLSKNHSLTTMIRTPSSYGRARGVSFNMIMEWKPEARPGSSCTVNQMAAARESGTEDSSGKSERPPARQGLTAELTQASQGGPEWVRAGIAIAYG
ncbi:NADH-ubiquinone oxidoreductase chain 4 [Ananas comosus]|uniref:NADH-ubiquinone oxidoreductase chain 4 n=1 Tax=Ananas comosus TaxID=4615 RepID=A0A199UF59_ANACO|nr:NADH-ubiquinone oxidoreductase chain 4 [Ananas comosus]